MSAPSLGRAPSVARRQASTVLSPKAVAGAQLALDRENLALTLAAAQLFTRDANVAIATVDQFTTRELDSLLGVVADVEHAAAASDGSAPHFTLLDLLGLLRNWHIAKRKFPDFQSIKRAVRQEIDLALVAPTSSSPPEDAVVSPEAATATRLDFSLAGTGGVSSEDKDALRSFFTEAERRLVVPGPDTDGPYAFTDADLEQVLTEKNSQAPTVAVAVVVNAPLPSKGIKDVNLSGTSLFLSSLRYIEKHLVGAGFPSVAELLTAVREHYRLLGAQMVDALKYIKTSQRLFTDPRITITWSLQREVLTLYTSAEGDLDTLPLLRKLERDRWEKPAYAGLDGLVDGMKQALVDAERKSKITDSDRSRVLAALVAASQPPTAEKFAPRRTNQTEHQPLLPLALLDAAAAKEPLTQVLSEYSLFILLQQIAVLTHNLAMKSAESTTTPAATTLPPINKPTPAQSSPLVDVSSKPAFASWQALSQAIHESVLESNRQRTEVLNLLAAPTCPLLSNSSPPVPITHESVDRLVKACGLMHADTLAVLHHLNDRGVRLKTLSELATRVKSFYIERRRAEQQSTRYAFMKAEIVAYLSSDACHLFLNPVTKRQVQADLDDAATFVQLMEACGGTLKAALTMIHSLESDELAFESTDGVIEGMRVWAARDVLKRQFLPFINNGNICVLFDKPGSKFKEVKPDDLALSQLLNIDISETAMVELRKHKPKVPASASAPSAPDVENSPMERVELILDFVRRMNTTSTRRFTTFQELVNSVQKQLENSSKNAANPLVPPTPNHRPKRSNGSISESASGWATDRGRGDQYQVGYESDEDIDPLQLNRMVPPSPSAFAAGPAGLSRKGSLAMRPAHRVSLSMANHGGDDIDETPEEKAAEALRRKQRNIEKMKKEVAQLQHHGWLLKDDDEWQAIDREKIEEAEITEDLLNDRRLTIFSALSYPACLLFSNRVEPMSLSDIDLDAVLSSAGGGEKGLRIATAIIRLLDKKGEKFNFFDSVTLEIARRWQRRKTWEYLTIDPVGKQLLVGTNASSVPLFVLRVLVAINRAHGVDPSLSAQDMLALAHEVHPEPFQSHTELLQLVKELVKVERRETLKAAFSTQFADLFTTPPTLTDTKMDCILAGVDESLYHSLKYLELIQAEGGANFGDVLDLVPLITSMHGREKSGISSGDAFADELEEDHEDAMQQDEEDAAAIDEDMVMLRRQKVFMALSFPACQLFTTKAESFTLTDVDLDDVVKAGNNRLAYALKTIGHMDKNEHLRFRSFYSCVLELAKRCQMHHATTFLLSNENQLLHHSVKLPRDKADPELQALVAMLIKDGMSNADPYLTIVACLKALNQVPKVLAQSPPPGGYRSIADLVAALGSLANEQRVWMVKSYFNQSTLAIVTTNPSTKVATKVVEPISDLAITTLLHSCANSIYFVLRHLQGLELTASFSEKPPVYEGYEAVLKAVADAHVQTCATDSSVKTLYAPNAAPLIAIAKPNEEKHQKLAEQRAMAAAAGTRLDKDRRDQILHGGDPNDAKIQAAAAALIEYERIEEQVLLKQAAPPVVLTPSEIALADARFQLVSALSFPKSNLFSKCIRPVAIQDAQLDLVLKSTFVDVEDERENDAAMDAAAASSSDKVVWAPTSALLSEALRLVKQFDASGYRFRTFAHFLTEWRSYQVQEKRKLLLPRLFFPQCRLFTACTRGIEIEERDLDSLVCLPKKTEAGVTTLPLGRVLQAIEQLDQRDTKVFSFVELTQRVRDLLGAQ